MVRNAKVLGLAIVAALALTAVMASAASATNFTAASYPVKISGSQSESHKFTVGGGTVTCTTANFSGELGAASSSLTVDAVYQNCTAFGFVGAKVTGFTPEEGATCDYTFYAEDLNTEGGVVDKVGKADLDCTGSGDITIDAGTCSVTLQAANNQGLSRNTYTNTPAGKVTVDTNVSGIHAIVTSGFACPVAGGTYTNGTYTGTTIVEGKNSKGVAVAIDVN
jgi:hypothetical protein